VLATAWRRRVPWYPGDWIWPVLAALVVAVLAGGIAILVTNDNGSPASTTSAVNETVTTRTKTGTTTSTASTSTETGPEPTSSVPTLQPPPPPPPAAGGLTAWPQGQNGWTIVLASVPQSAGRASAVSGARKASAAGLTDVGVLNSSEFSSLHSGYFVVFSGVFSTENEANNALGAATGTYPRAYVRQIVQ
jgi:hypothetical protein